jgi:hypothetical protein
VSSALATDRFVQAVSGVRYRRERPCRARLDEDATSVNQVCGNGAPRVDTTARPIYIHQSYRDVLNLGHEASEGE